jgi:hypothetical protein
MSRLDFLHGVGAQGYICLPNPSGGVSWTVDGARPEATLFARIFGDAVQIVTHFLSPVLKSQLHRTEAATFR